MIKRTKKTGSTLLCPVCRSFHDYNIKDNPAVNEDNTMAIIIRYITSLNLLSRLDFLLGAVFRFCFEANVKNLLKPICYLYFTLDRKSTRLNSSHVAISYA